MGRWAMTIVRNDRLASERIMAVRLLIALTVLWVTCGCLSPTAVGAPVPKDPNETTAEALVGWWRYIGWSKTTNGPEMLSITNYKKDGTFSEINANPKHYAHVKFGTYYVRGGLIHRKYNRIFVKGSFEQFTTIEHTTKIECMGYGTLSLKASDAVTRDYKKINYYLDCIHPIHRQMLVKLFRYVIA